MQRICNALQSAGYKVLLIGRKITHEKSISNTFDFEYRYVDCWFKKGVFLYAEFNIRLFIRLWKYRTKAICAVDLDTVFPVFIHSLWRNLTRIYDAHELFCEMTEIKKRPRVQKIWKWIERKTLPQFDYGYTVSPNITSIYNQLYHKHWITVRNISKLDPINPSDTINAISLPETFMIYQGALNVDRGIQPLIEAMQNVDLPLVICGEGNFSWEARALVDKLNLNDKIIFLGMLPPKELAAITPKAMFGFNLIESIGDHSEYSLANKFFDYIHAGIPQICSDLTEYRNINEKYQIAYLVKTLKPEVLASTINHFIEDKKLRGQISERCVKAKMDLNWEKESEVLVEYYQSFLPISSLDK
jgi:glycosyltransferase involved in cell wall biosynthesis